MIYLSVAIENSSICVLSLTTAESWCARALKIQLAFGIISSLRVLPVYKTNCLCSILFWDKFLDLYTEIYGMRKSNGPFIPANDYCDFISLKSFIGMNSRLELRIPVLTQPYSEVYCRYFCHLVFGYSLTKHNKFTSFSYSVVIFYSRFPTYRLVFMLTLPISHVCLSPVLILRRVILSNIRNP